MRKKIYKEDIIKAGLEIMYLKGYGTIGIKEITEQVNIPKGSFYNHFKNKEEFGLEVLNYYMVDVMKKLNQLLTDQDLSPIDRLKFFFQYLIENQSPKLKYKYGCLLGNFTQELADVNEDFRRTIQISFGQMKKSFQTCLEEAQEKGQIDDSHDPSMLADFLVNGYEGIMLRMKAEQSAQPIINFRDIVFNSVLK